MRFIKKMKNLPLRIQHDAGGELHINFLCDADFAQRSDQRSTIGVLGFVNNVLLYAECETLKTLPSSSCESESNAIFKATKAGAYVFGWTMEVIPATLIKLPMFIFNDNEAAIAILTTRSNSGRSKHFNVKLRYVTEMFENKQIIVAHIGRGENGADILTHALKRTQFEAQLVLLFGVGVREFLYGGSFRSGGETKWSSNLTLVGFIRLPRN
jgi:hypothetical protein